MTAIKKNRLKRMKRVGQNLDLISGNPGEISSRRHSSPYSEQLCMQQTIRFYYGVKKKQFQNYYSKAEKRKGSTGRNLLLQLESRLDNLVYSMGFASTRREAKQLISHKHIAVNGKVVNIASYIAKPGDVVSVVNESQKQLRIIAAQELASQRTEVEWLEVESSKMTGTYKEYPAEKDFPSFFKVNLVVELYSKC